MADNRTTVNFSALNRQPFEDESIFGLTSEFLGSALSAATTEFIGDNPSASTELFREEYPVAGFLSEALGFVAPFAIPFSAPGKVAARAIPGIRGVMEAAEVNRAVAPLKSTAMESFARLAPFEAGRLGASAAFADDPDAITETAFNAALDLALFPAIDVGFKAVLGTLPAKETKSIIGDILSKVKGLDPNAPRQAQLTTVNDFMRKLEAGEIELAAGVEASHSVTPGQGSLVQNLKASRRIFLDDIFREQRNAEAINLRARRSEKEKPFKWVRDRLTSGASPSTVNRLFNVSKGLQSGVVTRQLRPHAEFSVGEEVYRDIVEEISKGVPSLNRTQGLAPHEGGFDDFLLGKAQNFIERVQHPVLKTAQEVRSGKKIIKTKDSVVKEIEANLDRVFNGRRARDTWLAWEGATGPAVMARRVGPDRFVLFKTTDPMAFAPKDVKFAQSRLMKFEALKKTQAAEALAGSAALRDDYYQIKTLLSADVQNGGRHPIRELAENAVRRLPKNQQEAAATALENLGRIGETVGRGFKDIAVPTEHQIVSSTSLSRTLFGLAKQVFNNADRRATRLLFGKEVINAARSSFRAVTKFGTKTTGGIDPLVQKMTLDDAIDFTVLQAKLAAKELTFEELEQATASPLAKELIGKLYNYNKGWVDDMLNLERLVDGDLFTPDPGHFGISFLWRGSERVAVLKDSKLVAVGAGVNRKQAVEEAENLARAIGDNSKVGPGWSTGDTSAITDFQLMRNLQGTPEYKLALDEKLKELAAARVRGFERRRAGVRGYVLDPIRQNYSNPPFTKEEFRGLIHNQVFARERLRASEALRKHPDFNYSMKRLGESDPGTYNALNNRIGDLEGLPRPLAAKIERGIDKTLSPFLGVGGASKTIRALNRSIYNLTLGFGNIGFVALNAATGIQTVFPEIAHAVQAPIGRLAKHYTYAPLLDAESRAVGHLGILDPLKMSINAFREMSGAIEKDPWVKKYFQRAVKDGVLDPKFAEEFMGEKAQIIQRGFGGIFREGRLQDFPRLMIALSEYLPSASERFARTHAFFVGRAMWRDFRNVKDPELLYNLTREFVDKTMYSYGTADRAAIMSGAVGSTYGLFKHWMWSYFGNLMKYAGDAAFHGNFKPMLWAMGGGTAVAGLGGTPIWAAAEGINSIFSDRDLTEKFFEAFNDAPERVSGALFYGLPGLFDVTLQSSAALPGSDPVRDIESLYSVVLIERARSVAEAVGASIDKFARTGESPMDSAHVRDAWIHALAPNTFAKTVQVVNGEAVMSLRTQSKLIGDTEGWQRILYPFGLTPTDFDKEYTALRILRENQKKKSEMTTGMGRDYFEAIQRRDYEMSTRILREATKLGIVDGVIKSSMRRQEQVSGDAIERAQNDLLSRRTIRAFGE